MITGCVKKEGFPGVSEREQHTSHAQDVITRVMHRVDLAIQIDDGPGEQRAFGVGRIEQRHAIETCQLVG